MRGKQKTLLSFFNLASLAICPDLHRKKAWHTTIQKACTMRRTKEKKRGELFSPSPSPRLFHIIHFFSSMNWMNEKIFSSLNRHQKAIGRDVCSSHATKITLKVLNRCRLFWSQWKLIESDNDRRQFFALKWKVMAPTMGLNNSNGNGQSGDSPLSKTYQYRKIMKPMLERKRRARINRCLDELKELITGALQNVSLKKPSLKNADAIVRSFLCRSSTSSQHGI